MYYVTIHAINQTVKTSDVRDIFAFLVAYGDKGVVIMEVM